MTAEQIVAEAKDLPVVSETARKLTIQLNQPDLHREELVKTLRYDNVLTAKLLRVCNSAVYAAREPVDSLDQAILLLGDDAIFRIVSALGYGGTVGLSVPGYSTEANGLWTHSLCVGVGTEYLAKSESYGNFQPSVAFTAGLLHDLGKIVLNKIVTPKHRADIRDMMGGQQVTRVEAEKAVLGADHGEIGACLLKKWALPEPIIEAVANHHNPVAKPIVQLSAVIYLANNVSHLNVTVAGWETELDHLKKTVAAKLGLDANQVQQLIMRLLNAMQTLPQLQAAA